VKKRSSSVRQPTINTNDVCDLFDISKATLFRWERQGLISGPPRDWRNWRRYTQKNVEEIKKVIRARKIVV
jgi:DNA-binding transcriptional MerR regulator